MTHLAIALTVLLPIPTWNRGQEPTPAESQQDLASALRSYFAASDANGPELAAVCKLASGREAELIDILHSKAFVAERGDLELRGTIRNGHFVADETASNPALLVGPAVEQQLQPLIVYVPDTIQSLPYQRELQRDGQQRGYFVLLVPDEKRDNLYAPSQAETLRHVGPLRDLLLQHAIDPDRVYMVGSGRGGHATWDVGLMRSELWAGIYPCNGGLIHEGGFKTTGGVFVENAKDLTIFTNYNTSFDHGIASCRYATRMTRAWNTRFEAVEEPQLRLMGLTEAMAKLSPVVRRAHPRSITKRFNRLADGSHYWLQALSRRPKEWNPTSRITLRGTAPTDRQQLLEAIWAAVQEKCARLAGMVAGNTMRIETQGVGRVRIWLDPELIDFDAKLAITLNGKAQRDVKPRRQLAVMLQHVHATGDTNRLYWDRVDRNVPR